MEERAEKRKCPFFDICGASIVRDKIQNQKALEILVEKKMVVILPKWSQKFCFANFENCVHFQERNQVNASIGEK